jgi:hypothetical protein
MIYMEIKTVSKRVHNKKKQYVTVHPLNAHDDGQNMSLS